MSEAPEQDSKTEQPSEKRIRDAVEKGNLPYSKEATTFGSVFGILTGMSLIAGTAISNLFERLHASFEAVGTTPIRTSGDGIGILTNYLRDVAAVVMPFLLVLALGGILGAVGQNMPNGTLDRLKPKFERLSPSQNLKQVFGKPALTELASSTAKILAALFVAWYVCASLFENVLLLAASEPVTLFTTLQNKAIRIISVFTLLCMIIAILDVVHVRISWTKRLMMTRQEVKDEMKQSEGDPHVKLRLKFIGRRRLNSRMMANVPTATMVVVNPTHYAVAMRYVVAEGGAPVVIAKGMNHIALKIKNLCEKNRIPIIENAPLARSLHATTAVGSAIPPEFYKAVAEIVHFVELRRRLKPR